LAEGLAAIYREPVATVFAGRTDAGVHAAGQVVGLTEPAAERPPVVLRAALNWRLPDDVAVLEVGVARSAFHARFDAKWREYRYRIWSGERVPLADGLVWRRRAALDIGRMVQAAVSSWEPTISRRSSAAEKGFRGRSGGVSGPVPFGRYSRASCTRSSRGGSPVGLAADG
jgi:hypothetical protein